MFVLFGLFLQVDAMKLGLKEMKKEYKKVNIDEIEVCEILLLFYYFLTHSSAEKMKETRALRENC